MLIQPEISACSIVLLGQFNPAIFHPSWLLSRGVELVESAAAGDLLTHQDVATFSFDTRNYLVRTDRFQIETSSAPWIELLDISTKIFGENLHHTPITGFGINRTVHFRLPSTSSRIRLGRMLAPLEPWGEFGKEMNPEDENFIGGLQSLTMRRKFALDGDKLETNVTVEPSARVADNTAVYMHVNAHHVLSNLPEGHGSELAMSLLSNRFEPAIEEADSIIDAIMAEGKRQ